MKEKVILPIEDNVPFTAYQQRGYELGTLLTLGEKVKPWLYQFFVNIYMRRRKGTFGHFEFVFDKQKWFEGYNVFLNSTLNINPGSAFSSRIKLIELIKENINNSSYARGNFDEYYIPKKSSYRKRHFNHTFFLYGYDDDNENLYALGYTSDGKFERYEISYTDFIESFFACDRLWINFKKINSDFNFEFDPIAVRRELYEYVNSVYTGKGMLTKEVYGVSCIRSFGDYVMNVYPQGLSLDLRYSRFFMEYKKYMAEIVAYLAENKYISDCYARFCHEMSKSFERVHLLFLKYNMTGKRELVESALETIFGIATSEIYTMRNIYEELNESVEVAIANGKLLERREGAF